MKRNQSLGFSIIVSILILVVSIIPTVTQSETLLVWVPADLTEEVIQLGEQFEAEFGIAIEVQEVSFIQIADDLLNFGPVGEGPDVLVTENSRLGQLVANGALVPIDLTGMENLFVPSALNIFTYQNELWGMPYAWENIAFIRNTDLVPEAPATWQEVRTLSEEIQESGTAQYGFLLQSGNPYHGYPITSAFGGYIFAENEDGTYDVTDIGLNSDGGLAAAQWMSGMYQDGLMVPDVDDDVVFELFTSGELAMFVTGPWWSQRIVDAGVPYSIDALPGAEGSLEYGRPFSGGFAFAISAYSEKQFLAEAFLLDFMATKGAMETLLLSDDGSVLTRFPAFTAVDISQDPNVQGFIDAGANAIPMPQIPEMGAVWASWGNATTLVGQGEDPVESYETAVIQIAEAIDLALAEDLIVGVPGDLQDEAGCAADWDPACAETLMTNQGDGIFTLTITLPAGDYEYKVAMNGGWDENYGVDGEANGANIMLSLGEDTEVTFVYDDNTNLIIDSVNDEIEEVINSLKAEERIVGVPGNLQDEAGCAADWDPACENTLMTDQGDGIFTLTVTLPAGDYEYKVAMNGGWDENYGVDGEANGANIMLSLGEETKVTFTYDDNTNLITDSENTG
jgi:arabinogalactan oligomer / maltooligosaccharide transport system substrate-binding protein